MKELSYPRSVRRDMTVQSVGKETLIYDEVRHLAFCLNPIASAVWVMCDGTRGILEIAGLVTAELEYEVSGDAVQLAVDQLKQQGLLEQATGLVPAYVVSRRAMLVRGGAGAMMMLPVVAAIAAPKAAQAYTGCVDCSTTGTSVTTPANINPASPSESSDRRQITPE